MKKEEKQFKIFKYWSKSSNPEYYEAELERLLKSGWKILNSTPDGNKIIYILEL